LVFTCWTPSNQSRITMPDVTPRTGGRGTKRTKVRRKRNGSKMGSSNTPPCPPDDAFVTALIQASDPKYQLRYLQINALRILRTVSSETVVRLAKVLSVSKESAARRATVAALERVDSTGRLDVLRDLTKDSDVDVAENALRT